MTSATSDDGSTSSCSSVEGDLDVTSSSSEDEYYEGQLESFRYSHWTKDDVYGLDLKSSHDDLNEIYQRFVRLNQNINSYAYKNNLSCS